MKGVPLPEETLEAAKNSDAILMGAVGGPKWRSFPLKFSQKEGFSGSEKSWGYSQICTDLTSFDALVGAFLKENIVKGLDIMIVRELTGGIYWRAKGVVLIQMAQKRVITHLLIVPVRFGS